jgi:single-strand DNA-binding protein
MLKASVIGNLGGDAELRYSADGKPFLRFTVASNDRKRNAQGEYADVTTWVRVTLTGQRAESLGQYLKKGTKVYADGRLEARPWTTQEGALMPGLELLASEIQFMSPRDAEQANGQARPAQAQQPAATASQRPAPSREELSEMELPF